MLSNEMPSLSAAAACYRLIQCVRKGLPFKDFLPISCVQGKVSLHGRFLPNYYA